MSANAWLATLFESEPLRAALAFDAAAAGAPPSEPGSALALAWCAAQEMSGAQGAVAIPRGGAQGLFGALSDAAQKAGADIRTAAPVTALALASGAVAGVTVGGVPVETPLVLSTLTRRRTLIDLPPAGAIGLGAARLLSGHDARFGCATLTFSLNRLPDFGFLREPAATRTILAEKLESYETALMAARLGRSADEPVLELILPPQDKTAVDLASRLQLTVRAWPVLPGADDAALTARVTALIEKRAPGFRGVVAGSTVAASSACEGGIARLLSSARRRIETPVPGLYLCGPEAEPAGGLAARAARQAAALAIARHKKARAA